MYQDLMNLFYNDEKMHMLFMTNPLIYSCLKFCRQNQYSAQETLIEIVKVLADENKILNDRLIDNEMYGVRPVFLTTTSEIISNIKESKK